MFAEKRSGNVRLVKRRNGEILHITDAPLEPGMTVHGVLDWERRFDHMQQHSGEHILSGLVHAQFGYDNVGFHMNDEVVTVDFNGPITWEEAMELEEFFHSSWYGVLTQVDPDYLIDRLRKETVK